MSISVPTNSASTLSIGAQQMRSEQTKPTEEQQTAVAAPPPIEQVMARSDLAAIQLSQLHALALSLGQANPDNFAKVSGPESIEAPASTMDLYA